VVFRLYPAAVFIGLLLADREALASQSPQPSPIQSQKQATISLRQAHLQRHRAATSAELRSLAQQCQLRSDFYRTRQADLEEQLRIHHPLASPQSIAKHPTRVQTLKGLAERNGALSKQWQELGAECSDKAAQMDAAPKQ
jgi:hypothetical protein